MAALLTLACLVVAALSLLAPSAPTYDPFSWVIWGREILHLDLVTTNGPSWKPLPVMFTTVFALFGGAAPALWLVVARAGALAGVGLAFLTGRRLGAGPWAAAVAALTLGAAEVWTVNAWLGNSEGLLVALLLGAILAQLQGRPRPAFALGLGAALLRPEAWPFFGLYGLWLLWREPALRRIVLAGLAALPVLWLAPEWWGSGDLWRASTRARSDLPPGSPGAAAHPGHALWQEFLLLVPTAVWIALALTLLVALGAAARRRWRPAVALVIPAAIAAGWAGLVALMAKGGYSGNERYLIAPFALAVVLGGVGLGAVIERLPRMARPLAAVGAALLVVVPGVRATELAWPETMAQSRLPGDLAHAVARAGGAAHLRACRAGRDVYTEALLTPQVAWRLRLHLSQVTFRPVRGSALVVRGLVTPGHPFDPPMGAFAGLAQRTLATAPRWRIIVTGACAR